MRLIPLQTLNRRNDPLADPAEQQRSLSGLKGASFASAVSGAGLPPLRASGIDVLQLNLGKLCNQTCRHCHVDAGPERTELMTDSTLEACLQAVKSGRIPVVDLTGGAPEMHPRFRWLVAELSQLGTHVIDRCNLTILKAPGFEDLPEFFASQRVEVVASLPCYLPENTNRQRGERVFERSIEALRTLNRHGYGQKGSGLDLNLVYNPVGPKLPPEQTGLESAYKRELAENHGIVFNRLYTITNMPISRFLEELLQQDKLEEYVDRLISAFNPHAVPGVMCRNTLSVSWTGALYDCDFNQMLEIPLVAGQPKTIQEFDAAGLAYRLISTFTHCFGCTAGTGSSCQGSLLVQ